MLFSMPTADLTRKNIVMNSHLLMSYTIIKEQESHLIKPDPIIEENNHETQ